MIQPNNPKKVSIASSLFLIVALLYGISALMFLFFGYYYSEWFSIVLGIVSLIVSALLLIISELIETNEILRRNK